MTDLPSMNRPGGNPMMSRDHVVDLLHRVGYPDDRIQSMLEGMDFPRSLNDLTADLAQYGVTLDSLISRMGGSP